MGTRRRATVKALHTRGCYSGYVVSSMAPLLEGYYTRYEELFYNSEGQGFNK